MRVRTSPPSGPIAAHCPAHSDMLHANVIANTINNLPVVDFKIMCVLPLFAVSIPCGLRVTAYPDPFKLPKGSQKMGRSEFRPAFFDE